MLCETQDMRDTPNAREPCDAMLEIGDSGAGDVAAVVACALLSGVRIMFNVVQWVRRNPEYSRIFDLPYTWHGTALSWGPTSVHCVSLDH